MMLPDTYVVGAPKAGTTTVSQWLAGHDEVCVPVPQEPSYWAYDYPQLREQLGFSSAAAYGALFSGDPEQPYARVVDASTVYLYSQRAVPAILLAQPNARFVVCVRNPADLVLSYHRAQVAARSEPYADFVTAWRRSLTGTGDTGDSLDPKLLDYRLVGRQGAAVKRMRALVSEERLHVVVFDDLIADPTAAWRELAAYLEISPEPVPTSRPRDASGKAFPSPLFQRITNGSSMPPGGPVGRFRQWVREDERGLLARTKNLMSRTDASRSVTPELMAKLRDFFAEDVRLLAELIDRDLSHWIVGDADATEAPSVTA
ncbi:MAG: hypothetical protein GEU93_12070 [Propionibacteriales bacterium]|nr:hypothetical protein [Propionibacteriales bacterium]